MSTTTMLTRKEEREEARRVADLVLSSKLATRDPSFMLRILADFDALEARGARLEAEVARLRDALDHVVNCPMTRCSKCRQRVDAALAKGGV